MDLASCIDHTILKSQATLEDINKLCQEAKEYSFAAVCVNPCFVRSAKEMLKGTQVKVATVVGFPLGANTTTTKVYETQEAASQGADEIDMVMAVGWFKSGNFEAVIRDIREVVRAAGDKPVKVIIETCYLNPEEIKQAASLAVEAGAAYVKTSTGFGTRGAVVEDIKLIKEAVGERAKIKASGGIKTKEEALKMIKAGAARIGTSAGVAIINS
ncbi:MAG: deoxyribose-phosphate aldolase [Pseudomonadota bacterium]